MPTAIDRRERASSSSQSPLLIGLVHGGAGSDFLTSVGEELTHVGLQSQVIAADGLDPSIGLADVERVGLYVGPGSIDWLTSLAPSLTRRRDEDREFAVYVALADGGNADPIRHLADEVVRVPRGGQGDRAVALIARLLEAPVNRSVPALATPLREAMQQRDEPRSARWLVTELLRSGNGLPPGPPLDTIKADPHGLERRRGAEWIRSIELLFDPSRVSLIEPTLAIIGLGILQPQVAKRLARTEWWAALNNGAGPYRELLSPYGRLRDDIDRSPTVNTVSDSPSERDDLGRKAYGSSLGVRIRSIRGDNPDRAFSVLLNGPWGSGKTTLLGFIRRELEHPEPDPIAGKPDPWLVVRFSAWEHQHSRPPWWWLMAEIHATAAAEDLPIRSGLRLLWWRHSFAVLLLGIAAVIALTLALTGLAAALIPGVDTLLAALPTFPALKIDLTSLEGVLKVFAGALALASALFVLGRNFRSRRLLGSASGAAVFVSDAGEPLRALTHRLQKLIDAIGRPTVVFVDDIDRCSSAYVVEFLEGIQTLFSDTEVAFVVAGDRRWIERSYAVEYDKFASEGRFSGRSLGTFFLEKMFWLTADIPLIPDDVRDAYWSTVLGEKPADFESALSEAEDAARKDLATAKTEPEIRQKLARQVSPIQRLAYRNAAIHRLASTKLEIATEHQLRPYAPLLEANPRAMKQYVNRYAVDRDANLLTQLSVDPSSSAGGKLALWTILQMRWPELVDCLRDKPELIETLVSNPKAVDQQLPTAALFANADVQRVISGEPEDVKTQLSEQDIARLLGVAVQPLAQAVRP